MRLRGKTEKKILPIIILQTVSVVILIIALMLIKFFGSNTFKKLSELHNNYFEAETDINGAVENKSVLANANIYVREDVLFNNALQLPLEGEISSNYGNRSDPFTSKNKLHKGIDIVAQKGTDIVAVADGEVSFVGFDENGFGNYLTIAHGKTVKSLYGHCNEILVNKGEMITKGQIIAKVGNTGVSTGDHLHFEIRIDGKPINPNQFLNFE